MSDEEDIVPKLRDVPKGIGGYYYNLIQKSADEIEVLRAERDEAMEFVRGVANDVNALSTLPKDAIKFSELVYTIQVWGDNANEILTKKENA